ncbi:MAG: F0F1 ATP synthase subunit delta [Paludibacteraceae bacterium]|nr:F0F1 ATP synthase subunit delta [Paludibacteraceae bacterium]MBN2787330.1 F0F1 ATP synthase subunit delta [Paludibacteraceae bacterium]
MNEGRISIRYAQALYAMAAEKKCENEIYEQMLLLTQAFFQVPEFSVALSNPIYSKEQKLNLLLTAIGKEISKELRTFFEFVLEKGREEFLIFFSMSYQDIYRKEKKLVVGELVSATKLNDKALQKITDFVKARYNQKLELKTSINPDLIGGFVFEVNNQRMDASIKEELKKIQASMTA